MSLQIAAKHLASKGRGPDDTLVHMSRNEVKSLSDLAMAHGGQLSINPETGLPEAGFLSAILPMVAGAALAPATGGASLGLTSAWQTAALVGAGSMLLNPKQGLMGGLMAGLGAYGGANLGEALAQQGMEQAAGQKMLENQIAENTAKMGQNVAYPMGTDPTKYGYGLSGTMASGDMPVTLSASQYGAGVSPVDLKAALAAQTPAERFATMGQGLGTLTQPGGLSNLYQNLGGGMGTLKTATSALAPAMAQQTAQPPAPVVDKDMGQRYTYSPGQAQPLPAPDVPTYDQMLTQQGNFGRQQNYYPNQRYTPIGADQAKSIYGFAGGGPVEQMSNANAIGANTGFPQANLHSPAYSTPYQIPLSQNVVTGPSDTRVDPYTGEMKFADGGATPYSAEYYPGYSGYGNAASSSTSGSNSGSPTGSTIGDIGYALSNQSISPIAAAIAEAAMDALSPTSQTSVNAVSGLDAQSDAATATGASTAAGANGPAGASSTGMGSDVSGDSGVGGDSGEARGGLSPHFKYHMARGGLSDAYYNLGGYSDGGRLLRGPGDGVSDSIPATIGKKQPARLADGEFVVPARIVSEIGNGSTEAGARKLYAMMDRVQAARRKTVGKNKVAHNTRADKYLPA